MPLIGYIKECSCPAEFSHPDSKGRETDCVHLHHYARACPDPPISRLLAEVLYRDRGPRYGGEDLEISATSLTRCPLQVYMEKNTDYVEKVLDSRWKLRGTFAHEGLLRRAYNPRYMIEQRLRMPLEYEDGVSFYLYGTADVYEFDTGTIIDLKTQEAYAIDKKSKMSDEEMLADMFVRDNATQVNVYRVMLESKGLPVRALRLEYWDSGLRCRALNVPLADADKMHDFIKAKARILYDALSGKTPIEQIPIRPYPEGKWNPRKNSPVSYLIEKVMKAA